MRPWFCRKTFRATLDIPHTVSLVGCGASKFFLGINLNLRVKHMSDLRVDPNTNCPLHCYIVKTYG